jgi:hypothetical protein
MSSTGLVQMQSRCVPLKAADRMRFAVACARAHMTGAFCSSRVLTDDEFTHLSSSL